MISRLLTAFGRRLVSQRTNISVFVAIATAVLILQISSGAYTAEIGAMWDDGSHFVTGVMIADYLRHGLFTNPLEFATEYYVRYPKVAFGRWPPLFHVVQGAWYCLFGASKASAMALVGLITSTVAFLLYRQVTRCCGNAFAFMSVALFLAMPLVHRHSSIVMCDMPLCLICLVAINAYARFLESAKWSDFGLFFMWVFLASCTKGNGLALIPFAVLAPLITVPTSRRVWSKLGIGLIAIAIAVIPAHLLSGAMGVGHGTKRQILSALNTSPLRWEVVQSLFMPLSPVVIVLAATGSIAGVVRGLCDRLSMRELILINSSIAWVVSFWLFHAFCPLQPSARFFLPVLPSIIFLFACGVRELRYLCELRYEWVSQRLMATIVLVAGLLTTPVVQGPQRTYGYASAAAAIPYEFNSPVILLSSDSRGDSCFISERLMQDPSRSGIILRASKMFSETTWYGGEYQLRTEVMESLDEFLLRVPVHIIIIDESAFIPEEPPPHHELLKQHIANAPHLFQELGRFTISRRNGARTGDLIVYECLATKDMLPEVIRIDMENRVGEVFEFRPAQNPSMDRPASATND